MIEHDTPECPDCGGTKTRPMDDNLAHCFDCNIEWFGEFSELKQ